MEEIVFFGGVILFVLFGPWVLLWLSHRRRKREHEESQERWRELADRVYTLEKRLETFGPSPRANAQEELAAAQTPKPAAAAPSGPSQRPITPPAPQTRAEAWVKRELFEPSSGRPAPPSHSAYSPPPPSSSATETSSAAGRFRSALDVEETLGTNWLNKLGITILVLGIAFFLAYQIKTLGPAGKVLVGYAVSASLLGIGVWLEHKDRYRILARAGIGGGWALLFFTTYAMYHVPAAHVLDSQLLDLVLMQVIAAAMVWHTLRYRSQVVTGLAFLLAFLTVTVSHESVYSLSAGGILAAGLVVIVVRMQWFELEIFGILASYLNHFLWLRPIIEPMHGHRHPFPEFMPSAVMLALYWAIFRGSYVVRKANDAHAEHLSAFAALLNTALLLAILKYQSVHPEWAFWVLLAVGATEVGLGKLPITRQRRNAVIVLSTLGVILLIAAFPFRYSGERLSVLWLLESEALLLIGVWTDEVVFRRLGLLAALLVSGQMISFDAAAVYGRRMDGADLSRDFRAAIMFAVAAAVFYVNSHWVLPRWSDLFRKEFDKRLMQRLSYVAAFMALTAAWMAFPESWTAVAWCLLGLMLLAFERRFGIRDFGYQASVLAMAAFLRVLVINLDATAKYHGLTLRLITMSLVAILLYVASRWILKDQGKGLTILEHAYPFGQLASDSYTWAGSFLLSLLAWYELRPVGVAVVWVVGGLALLELGLMRKLGALRWQAYLLFLAGFLRIFFVNLNAAGSPGEISPRFYTVLPIALTFFYAYWRLSQCAGDLPELERNLKAPDLCCYLGTLTIASLMRFELEADWVAAAWSALALALLALSWRSGRRIFLHQGLLVVFGVLFRTILHNFYQRSYFPAPAWESRWFTAGSVVALLFVSLLVAFRVRKKDEVSIETGMLRVLQALTLHPEQVFFFIATALLTILLALEMRHGMVTVSWGVEGVAVFLLALWVGERSFRLTGLGLLLLCAGKILLVDVWRLNARDRYLTFIVLGVALLLVSFLYSRHREAIRQYL